MQLMQNLIKETVNQGGYVLQVYHIGNYNYSNYRSSIPDLMKILNKNLLKDIEF